MPHSPRSSTIFRSITDVEEAAAARMNAAARATAARQQAPGQSPPTGGPGQHAFAPASTALTCAVPVSLGDIRFSVRFLGGPAPDTRARQALFTLFTVPEVWVGFGVAWKWHVPCDICVNSLGWWWCAVRFCGPASAPPRR